MQYIRQNKIFSALTLGILSLALVSCETAQEAPSVLAEDAASAVKSAAKMGLSAEQAQLVGREMASALMKKYPLLESETESLYINTVGQYVAKHLDLGPKNIKCANKKDKVLPAKGFRFAVLDTDDKVSMSVPGGYVFVSKGLISTLKSEDELAGILAREATHGVCQDGVGGGLAQGNVKAFDKFFQKKVSRRQGKMADRGALMALYRAGYFPSDYIGHMESLATTPQAGLSSSVERVNWLKKDYAKMVRKGVVNTQKARASRFDEFKKAVTE